MSSASELWRIYRVSVGAHMIDKSPKDLAEELEKNAPPVPNEPDIDLWFKQMVPWFKAIFDDLRSRAPPLNTLEEIDRYADQKAAKGAQFPVAAYMDKDVFDQLDLTAELWNVPYPKANPYYRSKHGEVEISPFIDA